MLGSNKECLSLDSPIRVRERLSRAFTSWNSPRINFCVEQPGA